MTRNKTKQGTSSLEEKIDLGPKLGTKRDQGRILRKWRAARLREQDAQTETEIPIDGINLDEVSRRGFLGALGAMGLAAAAPGVAIRALATSDRFEPRIIGHDVAAGTITVEIDTDQGAMTITGQVDPDTFDDSFGGSFDYGTYPVAVNGRPVPDELIAAVDEKFESVTGVDFSYWVWENTPLRVAVEIYDEMYGDDGPVEDIDDLRREVGIVPSAHDDEPGTVAQAAKTAASGAIRTPSAATAGAAGFRELLQRVMSAGQTQPPVKDMGRAEPSKSTVALPAPDRSAADIMRDLQDRLDRSLTSQEQEMVQQELSRRGG